MRIVTYEAVCFRLCFTNHAKVVQQLLKLWKLRSLIESEVIFLKSVPWKLSGGTLAAITSHLLVKLQLTARIIRDDLYQLTHQYDSTFESPSALRAIRDGGDSGGVTVRGGWRPSARGLMSSSHELSCPWVGKVNWRSGVKILF